MLLSKIRRARFEDGNERERAMKQLKDEVESLNEEIVKAQSTVQKLEGELTESGNQIKQLKGQLAAKDKAQAEWNAHVDKLKKKIKSIEDENSKLKGMCQELEMQKVQVHEQWKDNEKKINAWACGKLDAATKENDLLRSSLAEAQALAKKYKASFEEAAQNAQKWAEEATQCRCLCVHVFCLCARFLPKLFGMRVVCVCVCLCVHKTLCVYVYPYISCKHVRIHMYE